MTKTDSGAYCTATKRVNVEPTQDQRFGQEVVIYNDYGAILARTYYGGLLSRNIAANRQFGSEVITGMTGDSIVDRAMAYHPLTHVKAAIKGDQVINSATSVKGVADVMRTLGIECVNEAGDPVTPVLSVDDVVRIGASGPERR